MLRNHVSNTSLLNVAQKETMMNLVPRRLPGPRLSFRGLLHKNVSNFYSDNGGGSTNKAAGCHSDTWLHPSSRSFMTGCLCGRMLSASDQINSRTGTVKKRFFF